MAKVPLSIYIHFPWCLNKCPYCDFNSCSLSDRGVIDDYVDRLLFDIEWEAAKNGGYELASIYFGGGTPSLLAPDMVERIIEKIESHFKLTPKIEISLEANPGTIDLDLCRGFKQAGINRFSLGVQSFNNDCLKGIGRIHDSSAALKAIEAVITSGFNNFNLDLMFGLPEQTVKLASEDLETALSFSPNHLSWYQLTLEEGRELDDLPHSEKIWDIQQAGQEILKKAGLKQYEVSAFSRSDEYRCKHNVNYWQYGDYVGVGAGAHGKITLSSHKIKRYAKASDPVKYIKSLDLIESEEVIAKEKIALEFMLNALRLYQPINYSLFQARTGFAVDIIEDRLQQAKNLGLIELRNRTIITTDTGKNFLNDLLEVFL